MRLTNKHVMKRSWNAQILIINARQILLGRWQRGPFKGRITAPISSVYPLIPSNPPTAPEHHQFVAAARQAASDLAGIHVEEKHMTEVARLMFTELDLANPDFSKPEPERLDFERVFLCQLPRDVGTDDQIDAGFVPNWHALADLPFAHMPKDDELWYPKVLAGERVEGEFTFRGEDLVHHEFRVPSF